jgi:hypothetical protein
MFARVAVRSACSAAIPSRVAASGLSATARPSLSLASAAGRSGLSTARQQQRSRGQRGGAWHESDNSEVFTSGLSFGTGTALALGLVAGGLLWYESHGKCEKTDWSAVRSDIKALLHAPGYDDGDSTFPLTC